MYLSLEKLHGPVTAAANNYDEAAGLLALKRDEAQALASKANKAAWEIVTRRLQEAQRQLQQAQPAPPPPPPPQAHATRQAVPLSDPTPHTFPTIQEQQGTVCPNCHRPTQKQIDSPQLRSGSKLDLGGSGMPLAEDERKLIEQWVIDQGK
jgi:hypothetical protein